MGRCTRGLATGGSPFASRPDKGIVAFVSDDPVASVEEYFAARAKGAAMSAEQLAETGKGEPDMEAQMARAMGMAEEYQKLMEQGKTPEEIGRIMGAKATATMGEDLSEFANDFSDEEVFSPPRFYVLEKAQATGRPVRVAAVFLRPRAGQDGHRRQGASCARGSETACSGGQFQAVARAANHTAVARRPSASGTAGRTPSSRAIRSEVMHERRCSPDLAGPWVAGRSTPTAAARWR